MTNFVIKQNAEDLLKHLKPLSVAVDKIHEKNYTIAADIHIWEELEKDLMEEKALHFLDYLLDLHYAGINLNISE